MVIIVSLGTHTSNPRIWEAVAGGTSNPLVQVSLLFVFLFVCFVVFFSLGTGEKFKGFGTIYQSSKLRAEDLRRPEKVPSTIFGFSLCVYMHTRHSCQEGSVMCHPSQGQR